MTAVLERAGFGEVIADGTLDLITIGSLCSGYEGLGMAVQSVIGGRLAWVADNDPVAAALLAYRFPDVPNLGDIAQVDWNAVMPVDVLQFGFSCQDISQAGGRVGLREDTRSGNTWAYCFQAVAILRPSLVVIENVRSLTSADADSDLEFCPECMGDRTDHTVVRALGVLLGDLADIGYDTQWCCVRASDAGAPHKRDRIFILAWPAADTGGGELQRRRAPGLLGVQAPAEPREGDQRERAGHAAGDRGPAAPGGPASGTGSAGTTAGGGLAADPLSPGLEVRPVEHHGPECAPAERGGSELPGPDPGLAPPPCPYVVGCDAIERGCPDEPGRWHTWAGYCTTDPHALCAEGADGPVAFLPTPQASDGTGGRVSSETGGRRPSGARRSIPLGDAVDHLLKTPTAQLAVNGGSQHPDKRRAGGHGPTLADQVEHELALLPTPTSTLGGNAGAISQAKGREGGTLVEALSLLPTPTAADSRNTRNATAGRAEGSAAHSGTTLCDAARDLLPTPCVADADGTRATRGGERSGELLLTGIAREVAVSVDWGKYEPAIRRWERILGRPAPCPVRQGKTSYVLAPELPEWMMGLPPGWVTAVPGLTRTAALKLIGNGVVPQQGALATRALLDAIGWLPLRNLLAARALSNPPEQEKEVIS